MNPLAQRISAWPARKRQVALLAAMLIVLLASLAMAEWVCVSRQPPGPPHLERREIGILSLAVPADWESASLGEPTLTAELRDVRTLKGDRDDKRQLLVARLPEAPLRPPGDAMQQAMSLLLPRTGDGLPIERSRIRRIRVGPATGTVCEALTHQRQRKHFLAVLSIDGRQQFVVYLSGPVLSDARDARQAVMELRDDRSLFEAILESVHIARWQEPADGDARFARPSDAAGRWSAQVDQTGDGLYWLWTPEAEDGVLRHVRTRWVPDTIDLNAAYQLSPAQLLAERYWLAHERAPSAREMAQLQLGAAAVWQVNLSADARQVAAVQEQVWLARIAPGRLMLIELTTEPAGLRQTVLFVQEVIAAAGSRNDAAATEPVGRESDRTVQRAGDPEAAVALGERLREAQTRLLTDGPASEQDLFLIERDGQAVGWEVGRLWLDASGQSLRARSSGQFGQALRVRSTSAGRADASTYVHTRELEHLGPDGQQQRTTTHRLDMEDGTLRFEVGHDGGPMRLVWEMPAPEPMLTPLASSRWPLDLLRQAATPAIAWMRWGGSRPAPFEIRLNAQAPATADGRVRIWVRPLFSTIPYRLTLDTGGRSVRYESLWEGAASAGNQWHATERVDLETLRQRFPQAVESIDSALRELERENDPPV